MCKEEKLSWLLIGLGSLCILLFYGKNVRYLNTVWELVDEYGYLSNAAYLSHTDWSFITNMYYGYGYSIWLVPLFWICNTGTQIIKCAVLINTGFIILTFWTQIALMSKLCKKLKYNYVIGIAFVLSFYPYLVSSNMKVLCECLLNLMIWVCGLLFYLALEKGKWYYYVSLAVAIVYTLFVHTRALIFCGVLLLAIFFSLLQNKKNMKNVVLFILLLAGLFLAGFVIKNQIINHVNLATQSDVVVTVGNTLSLELVIEKICKFFTKFSMMQLYSLACKVFYLFVATAGMFHIGIYAVLKEAISEWKIEKFLSSDTIVKGMYAIAAVLMYIALVVNSYGDVERTAYFFYGRYYEYLVGPVTFMGIRYCIENRLHIKEKVIILVAFMICGWLTLDLYKYLETWEFNFDSNRIASFSYIIDRVYTYDGVIFQWLLFTLGLLMLLFGLNRAYQLRTYIPIVVLILFSLNNKSITEGIISIHQNNTDYYEVATFIHMNYDVDKVYFLNNNLPYEVAFAAIQSDLGKEKLVLLNEVHEVSKLNTGDVLVTFQNHIELQQSDIMMTKVAETNWFEIYLME